MIYHIGYVTDKYIDLLKRGDVFKEDENYKFDNDEKKNKKWYVLYHLQDLCNIHKDHISFRTDLKVLNSIFLTDNTYDLLDKPE
jgi:hypothetical protein